MTTNLVLPAGGGNGRTLFSSNRRHRLQLLKITTGIQPVFLGGHLLFQPNSSEMPHTARHPDNRHQNRQPQPQLRWRRSFRGELAVQEVLPPLTSPRPQQRQQQNDGHQQSDIRLVLPPPFTSPRGNTNNYIRQEYHVAQRDAENEQAAHTAPPHAGQTNSDRFPNISTMAPASYVSNRAQETNNGQCCICLERQSLVLFLPCRHLCTCDGCLRQLQKKACPYCNQPYRKTTRVFIP
ncbi:Zinc finger, C3HC4 type (RING finger), putative [Trypanosoma equiperdum]|uniref:RING-type domain-containing protein n=2 Tax=Trypanozoon TaxID=39700 RepID=Q580X7_TRYB2|nr:hypothetical protein, conserved [Trypanosoma brucei brucei TREU927]AAX78976.1 hypothetical protein, conserved [Trypanosoma brucei]AAZ13122.1 hypothetical protein, conserved [Trypanosoma brucei brucei TREU927]SCU71591.1 Zinc finger, C3HC4 type (RING finger), putative [Trypanosoma equiperdum]